ncbi:hypothetical protein GCM10022267_83650 [Lentzea roselyniae]|uniref:Uncharacterized protein n=1 Tax=Lentzea roselyniae TaxID=531940 RepID=A0ABP7C998_9PSEU
MPVELEGVYWECAAPPTVDEVTFLDRIEDWIVVSRADTSTAMTPRGLELDVA